jgi:hypothetical protein
MDKTGVNADGANIGEQVDRARTESTEAKPARYVANLLGVGRATLYRALVA